MPLSKGISVSYFKIPYVHIPFVFILIAPLIFLLFYIFFKKKFFLYITFFTLFSIIFIFPIHCSIYDIKLISRIYNEQRQIQNILNFTALLPPPPNRQYTPGFEFIPDCFSLINRIKLWFSYIGWGYISYILMGLSLIYLILKRNKNNYLLLIKTIICVSFTLFILYFPFLFSEYFLILGDLHLKRGEYNIADHYLNKALSLNKNLIFMEDVLYDISVINCNFKNQTSWCKIEKAKKLYDSKQYEKALIELKIIPHSFFSYPAYLSFLTDILINAGINEYSKKHTSAGLQSSIPFWENTMRDNSDQMETYFYLAYSYLKLGHPNEAINSGKFFLNSVKDQTFRAYIYCFLGDAYMYLKKYKEARIYYEKSYLTDPFDNYLAMWKMTGS